MAMRNLIDPLDFTLDETGLLLMKKPTATLLTTKSLLLYSMNQAQELVYPLSQQC